MKFLKGISLSFLGLALMAGSANAGSLKDDEPVERDRPELSANVTITSDYVFRGFSQSDEHVAIQGGFDVTYRFLYAGVWASSLDFADVATGGTTADIEVDLYAGIKHKIDRAEFDVGVIYYLYPDADDPANGEYDYVEIKAGVSGDVTDRVNLGFTVFYSPEFFGEVGDVVTYEGAISVGLGEYDRFKPTFSALIGYADFQDQANSSYTYWNAGVEIGLGDKFTLDLRYWDTDVNNNNFADARFVAGLTAAF